MRAWQIVRPGPPGEALALCLDVAPPEPGPGQLRVRVSHAGVGLPDALMCRGADAYPLAPPLPFTPGQECVGTVVAAGPGAVTPVGARVLGVTGFFLGHGSFADECLLLDDFALPAPDSLDDAEAAGFAIPSQTAWVGLVRRARLQKGEWLLVTGGAGGTGSAAVSLGHALGARVIATASGVARGEACRSLGAEVVVDRSRGPIEDAVRTATGGHGVDVVYETAGGEAFAAASRCMAHEGRLLAVGFASGRWGDVRVPHLVDRSYSVLGVQPSGYDRAFRAAAHAELLSLRASGSFRVPVDAVWGFDAVPEAVERVASGAACGKVVIRVAAPGRA
jgi:NADPH2:quinone reductase